MSIQKFFFWISRLDFKQIFRIYDILCYFINIRRFSSFFVWINIKFISIVTFILRDYKPAFSLFFYSFLKYIPLSRNCSLQFRRSQYRAILVNCIMSGCSWSRWYRSPLVIGKKVWTTRFIRTAIIEANIDDAGLMRLWGFKLFITILSRLYSRL